MRLALALLALLAAGSAHAQPYYCIHALDGKAYLDPTPCPPGQEVRDEQGNIIGQPPADLAPAVAAAVAAAAPAAQTSPPDVGRAPQSVHGRQNADYDSGLASLIFCCSIGWIARRAGSSFWRGFLAAFGVRVLLAVVHIWPS